MIERFITNSLTLKRYRRFKSKRLAVLSLFVFSLIVFFSFTAELWVNNKPVILSYSGEIYFPAIKRYHPSVFGIQDQFITDYRKLEMKEGDWTLWPLVRWDPYESNKYVDTYPAPPTFNETVTDNWLGTDDRGRDVLARLIYGFRYSIVYAFLVWAITFSIGISLGGVMGYAAGKVDFIGQRVVEILSTVPQFFLLIILISLFQPNLLMLVGITSLFGWISISYYMRGEFLKLRKMDFVDAARSLGASHARLIFRHILPNALGPVLTFSPFVIAGNITSLAALDFLGFGLPQPTPSWGELLAQAQKYFRIAWWLATYPSLALFTTLVLLSIVGEGVRDAFDPKK
jgi:microcin C transport system permease protein